MLINRPEGPSSSGPGQSQAISCDENLPAEERGNEAVDKHMKLPDSQEQKVEQEQGHVPANALPGSANAASSKKIFGTIRKPNSTIKKGNDSNNYEEKYTEDAIYEETAPNARVWITYEDESKNHDTNMVEESRDNVDALLVFAGLFSAVVTTFVAQTYQNLQVNYAATSASLLFESVLLQRAIANGSSVDAIAPSQLSPNIAFVPATTDVWVNGLWFTSLFLSLTTALVAVLAKQWLHHYVVLPSGTPRDRSFTRQFRYDGFRKWHVQVIIGLLPVLMHLALAIFLAGLVVFLHPLRAALSWTIGTGTVFVYAAYIMATSLPIFFPQCPYRTPLCNLLYISVRRIIPQVSWNSKYHFLRAWRKRQFSNAIRYLPHIQTRNTKTLTVIESECVQQMSTNLAAEALDWLFSVSSNSGVQGIVVQSAGGLPMVSWELLQLQPSIRAMEEMHQSLLKSCLHSDNEFPDCDKPVPGMETRLERLLRFCRYHPRYIIPPDVNSFELGAAIQSTSVIRLPVGGRPAVLLDRAAFLRDIIHPGRSLKLPLLCWSRLMRIACGRDVFSFPDPESDSPANTFLLHLCSAILYTFDVSQKGVKHDFTAPTILEFKDALPYFSDDIYDAVLYILSQLAGESPLGEPLSVRLRAFIAAVGFFRYRLSLPSFDMSYNLIHTSLHSAVEWINAQTFSPREAIVVTSTLEDILAACVVQKRDPHDVVSPWNGLSYNTMLAYQSSKLKGGWRLCSLRGLQLMVDVMTVCWGRIRGHSPPSDIACSMLADALADCVPAAYTVFFQNQCLEFFGNRAFHMNSVRVVREYCTGVSAMVLHRPEGAIDAATLQQHVEYLHEPQNIFIACSILAAHEGESIDRPAIRRDIRALAHLRPQDPGWDACRRQLRDLIENDGGNFFDRQGHFIQGHYFGSLSARHRQVKKNAIRYVIGVLDAFFEAEVHNLVS
ncbi:hypothetical protein F5146DRAFT_1227645 [Armillaria mellea]|nr:hypothetical protein F5146DRAFT_1227645 [Armillaria mellea]